MNDAPPRPVDPTPITAVGCALRPGRVRSFSEGVARYLGTARFLVIQSVVIVIWLVWNNLVSD